MRAHGWLMLTGLLAAAAPVARARAVVDSTATAARHAPLRSQLGFALSLTRGHDDNFLQLTQSNIDLFAARPGPPRFLISQVGDMLTTVQGDIRWRGRLLPRRATSFAVDAGLRRFDHNRVCDWQQYGASASQELTAAKRNLATLDLAVSHIPNYYLGQITDLDESVAAGRNIRNSLAYAQTAYVLRLRQDLLHSRISLSAGRERLHRVYDEHFLERSNDNDQWRLSAEAVPFHGWPATIAVTWLRGDLNARGDIPDTLGVVDTDISYDHDGIGAAVLLPWGHGAWRGRFEGWFMPEVRTYTTDNKFDIQRFGRENHRRDTRLRASQRVWGPVEAVVTWERLISRAEFHQGITFPSDITDFSQEMFGIGLRARWDLLLH
jgi:hypothetical protein